MEENELFYRIALTKVTHVGPILAKTLLASVGSCTDIFRSEKKSLSSIPGISEAIVAKLDFEEAKRQAEKDFNYIQKNKIKALFYSDPEYPKRLKHFDHSPILLYYKGSADLNPAKTVGIVGTRTPTHQGVSITEKFVDQLGQLGVTVVSGLAFGIDGAAHRQSVQNQVPTIGVLGHGLDIIYPQEHRHLSQKMADEGGGLLTEFGIETKPDKQNFPMRNRIIAGMCDAIIVIESKIKGGSIITAEMANEFSKDVFAVPGTPGRQHSAGCNSLIKRHKAHLIENIEDLKYIMRWEEIESPKNVQASLFVDLTDEEKEIIESIRHAKEIGIDELSYKHNKPSSYLANLLLTLEFKGTIRSIPGNRYIVT